MPIRPDQPGQPGLPVQDVSFLGEASKAAPMLAKRLAESLTEAGKDAVEVFKQTGWFKDLDGFWKYEVGDKNFKLADNQLAKKVGAGTGPRVLRHPPDKPGLPSQGTYEEPTMFGPHDLPTQYPPQPKWSYRAMEDQPVYGRLRYANIPPLERFPEAQEIFQHPGGLFEEPHLGGVPVDVQYKSGDPGGSYTAEDAFFPYGLIDAAGPGNRQRLLTRSTWTENRGNVHKTETSPTAMESTALHELGHAQQQKYGWATGGNPREPGMGDQGYALRVRAAKRRNELKQEMWDYIDSNRQTIDNDVDGEAMWRRQYPDKARLFDQYRNYANIYWPDDYLGYRGQAGEAASRNIQHRAEPINLRQSIPMTGETDLVGKPHIADVHPFQTLDMPPDLLNVRNAEPGGVYRAKPGVGVGPGINAPDPDLWQWLTRK